MTIAALVRNSLIVLALWAGHSATARAADINLERFLDGVMETHLAAEQTVGATVSVVQDGRLLLAKGYGYADLAEGRPVLARETLFRVGSISKVLVWIAVMQQIEAGKLDLDADVNHYLTRFQIDQSVPKPITLRHLMTHTPGLEDRLRTLFVSGPRALRPLHETLERQMPARLWLPGTVVAYSNYGAALAAHLVESVSEMDWDDYVDEFVLAPLAMTSTTTRQPPATTAMSDAVSQGYQQVDGYQVRRPFEYISLAPAGSTSATALDIARLMVELLNPRETAVLNANSKQRLLTAAYLPHQKLNGLTLGLYEQTAGGARAVGHGGDTILFHSRMVLWPEKNLGLFVSMNTDVSAQAVDQVVAAFARYHGLSPEPPVRHSDLFNGQRYVGQYAMARREESNFMKLFTPISAVDVSYDPDRSELVLSMAGRAPRRYVVTDENDLFFEVGGHDRLGFFSEGDQISGFHTSAFPVIAFHRSPLSERRDVNVIWLLGVIAINLLVLLIWPVSSFTHRSSGNAYPERRLALLAGLCALLVLGFFVTLATSASDQVEFILGGASRLDSVFWLPVVLVPLVFMQLWSSMSVWKSSNWWFTRRLHFTLMGFANLSFLWWCWIWRTLPDVILSLVV